MPCTPFDDCPHPLICTCGSPSKEPCSVEKSNIQTKLLIHPFMLLEWNLTFVIRTWQSFFDIYTKKFVQQFKAKGNPEVVQFLQGDSSEFSQSSSSNWLFCLPFCCLHGNVCQLEMANFSCSVLILNRRFPPPWNKRTLPPLLNSQESNSISLVFSQCK